MPMRQEPRLAYGLVIHQAQEVAERIAARLRELSERFTLPETVGQAEESTAKPDDGAAAQQGRA